MRNRLPIAATLLLLVPALAHAEIPGDKIKIGVLQDLPEPYAEATGNGGIVAAQLAAADFEKEYLKGDAEILPYASTGGMDDDLKQVHDWLDKEHVAAVLSSAGPETNRRIASLVQAEKRTLLVAEAAGGAPEGLCSPSAVIWGPGAAGRVRAIAQVLADQGKKKWYLIAEQNPDGVAIQASLHSAAQGVGGQIVGETQPIVGSLDIAHTVSDIDKSGADATILGESDDDLVSALRGINLNPPKNPVSFAAPYAQIADIDNAGPSDADGLIVATPFYWDTNDETRRFATMWQDRMQEQHVTQNAAEVYAATLSFLRAAKAVDDLDAGKIGAELRRAPIGSLLGSATVRDDGRVLYDMGVYQVKSPDRIEKRWAYYAKIATIPGAKILPPSACAGNGAKQRTADRAAPPATR